MVGERLSSSVSVRSRGGRAWAHLRHSPGGCARAGALRARAVLGESEPRVVVDRGIAPSSAGATVRRAASAERGRRSDGGALQRAWQRGSRREWKRVSTGSTGVARQVAGTGANTTGQLAANNGSSSTGADHRSGQPGAEGSVGMGGRETRPTRARRHRTALKEREGGDRRATGTRAVDAQRILLSALFLWSSSMRARAPRRGVTSSNPKRQGC